MASIRAPLRFKRTILFGDCDPAGIVYTPRFTDYALEATHQALNNVFGEPAIRAMHALNILTPVRATNIEYLSPITWDDEIELLVCVNHVGSRSYTFSVAATKSDKTVFDATITFVCVCAKQKQTIPIPQQVRDKLNLLTIKGS
ncbi:acyl-CoA thioesterase [Thalassotalea euphylliae]|uniref:acyl-CoA thioesterase n=1 Tax=Thalassotalea euphylliae TaxID=1655234 RepID=UPI00363A10D8